MLKDKHIILGITGSIAAYKAAILTRLLVKAGAEVKVVMTPAAKEFIAPLTLATLSQNAVISEFFTANTGEWHSHVSLGLWADAMLVAPATASTIAKMANGVADNMLVTTYLSAKCPVFVAPAMDLDMMAHPSTVANLERLRSYGNTIIEPAEGFLASTLVGKGRMEEPDKIVAVLEQALCPTVSQTLAGKHVLITAGPTHESIDPVRFIGNRSSGKMGYALAEEAARRGAKVSLVSGPVNIRANHPQITTVSVESAREMLNACLDAFPTADIAIMCAAVADYAPAEVAQTKIKREKTQEMELKLVANPDIAATLGAQKRPGQLLVGFALETNNEEANAEHKLDRKNLDAIVLNSLQDPGAGFMTDTNRIKIIARNPQTRNIEVKPYPLKSKAEVAADILDFINP
ncbi:MAG: bifunctional phosphopantothenoylcysteine decarboxylase/phosphopantothenate--cysteine ligase CoaBC [Muribaculaceae bacterium]|nr:bifunctional phosphopantothenoylcysteine decarboxylase/phosphopantothenate--cysteine ligase CoaBC [Muribaculaceae bacterium]